MHLRKALLQPAQHVQEILQRKIRVQSAHDVELRHRLGIARRCRLEDLLQRHRVSAFGSLFAPKGAQPAGGDAHVGVVDVPIHIEVGDVAMHPLPHMVGQPAQGQHVRSAIKRQRVALIKTFVRNDFVMDRVEPRVLAEETVTWRRDGIMNFRHLPMISQADGSPRSPSFG